MAQRINPGDCHTQQAGKSKVPPMSSDQGLSNTVSTNTSYVDMVDSYLTGVGSTRVTSADYSDLCLRRKISITPCLSQNKAFSDTNFGNGMVELQDEDLATIPTSLPEVPREMPGLSIVTWEEFIEDPTLLHNLFTLDKDEFIHFDNSVVSNFFHDSRMDPPTLGGPSGDGMSWTIFVDSYSHLRHVRDTMTSLISVLLVDLVKPDNEGTASCLVAINPNDDHIRRVLHLTLSRAMETLFASRCFCIEIDLTQSVQDWCKSVLQVQCNVLGGRIIITNGDAAENCCEVDDRKYCILCFPVWAFKKIRYMIKRRRRYDDTRVEFESSSLVLCTKSDKLRHYSEAAQLSHGQRIINKNTKSVTMATQTLSISSTSLQSDLSVEVVEDAADNDVSKYRDLTGDVRGALNHDMSACLNYPNDVNNSEITYSRNPIYNIGGVENSAFVSDNEDVNNNGGRTKHTSSKDYDKWPPPDTNTSNTKTSNLKQKSISFSRDEASDFQLNNSEIASELLAVEMANKGQTATSDDNSGRCSRIGHVSFESFDESHGECMPSPRQAFILRPDTPFHSSKTKSSKVKSPCATTTDIKPIKNNDGSLPFSLQPTQQVSQPIIKEKNEVVNDQIAKRQKKIGLLLKDLVLSSTTPSKAKAPIPPQASQTEKATETSDDRAATINLLFSSPNPDLEKSSKKVKQTLVKGWDSQTDKVFPYTSDLINFPYRSTEMTEAALEKFGARKKKKEKSKSKTEDMLFRPRLNLEAIGPDRNCFSDQDIADSDVTDLETEPENTVSDTEGMTSSRWIPVRHTDRTVSVDSVNNKSDVDEDLQITDCEMEEEQLAKKLRTPKILPGALAAHQLRAASARVPSARSRDYIPPNENVRRRGGNQNDSRRRYLALNSLRRKAYNLNLQSQVRNQTRPSSAELLSYNTRKLPSVTIMSQV